MGLNQLSTAAGQNLSSVSDFSISNAHNGNNDSPQGVSEALKTGPHGFQQRTTCAENADWVVWDAYVRPACGSKSHRKPDRKTSQHPNEKSFTENDLSIFHQSDPATADGVASVPEAIHGGEEPEQRMPKPCPAGESFQDFDFVAVLEIVVVQQTDVAVTLGFRARRRSRLLLRRRCLHRSWRGWATGSESRFGWLAERFSGRSGTVSGNDFCLIAPLRDGFIRSEVDLEFDGRERNLIPRQQSPPDDFLTVDPRAIAAAQIPNEQQTVGFRNNAVYLGDTAVIDMQITQLPVSAHNCDVPINDDRCSSGDWN